MSTGDAVDQGTASLTHAANLNTKPFLKEQRLCNRPKEPQPSQHSSNRVCSSMFNSVLARPQELFAQQTLGGEKKWANSLPSILHQPE